MRCNRGLIVNPSQECHLILQKYFKHTSFRENQLKIILNTINGGDSLVVMATGSGKSLCYQIPPIYCKKAAIVVSPLVSLIQNQVKSLQSKGITSIGFTGASKCTNLDYKQAFENNAYSVIYLTPEGLESKMHYIKTLYTKHGISCIAIDESHCVSEWGHDFRPKYKTLHILRDNLANIPILGLTATATKQVQHDIIRSLKLGQCGHSLTHIISSFDRPNLSYTIKEKKQVMAEDLCSVNCKLQYYSSGSTIIYTVTQKLAEKIANTLIKHGINASAYHAGINHKQRREIQNKWEQNDIQCIVATIAFGMGIDKEDIRYVIHYGVPDSIEGYYQQIGRAGRDGKASKCVLFWSGGDFSKSNWRASNTQSKAYQDLIVAQCAKMKQFVHSRECRVKYVLRYFGEEFTECVDRCDNCIEKNKQKKEKHNQEKDYTEQSKNLVMATLQMRQRFGLNAIIEFVNGKDNAKTKKISNKESMESFGSLKDYSVDWIKALARKVIEMGFLSEVWTDMKGFGSGGYGFRGYKRISVTDKGRALIRGECSVTPFIPENDMVKAERRLKSKTTASNKWQFKGVSKVNKTPTVKSKTKPSAKWAFNNVLKKRSNSQISNDGDNENDDNINALRASLDEMKYINNTKNIQNNYYINTTNYNIINDRKRSYSQISNDGDNKSNNDNINTIKKRKINATNPDISLKQKLIGFRKKLSAKKGLISYQIINNDGIDILNKYRPSDIAHLERISAKYNIKTVFTKNYGRYFCKLISDYCNKNSILYNIESDDELNTVTNQSNMECDDELKTVDDYTMTLPPITNQSKEIYKAFVCGDNIQEIVKKRVISRSTVEKCLSNMIINGYKIGEMNWNRLPFSMDQMKSCFMSLSKNGVGVGYDIIRDYDTSKLAHFSDSQIDLLIARYIVDHLKKAIPNNDAKQWNVRNDNTLWDQRDECIIEIARNWQRSESFIMDRLCYLRSKFGQNEIVCNGSHDPEWNICSDICLYNNRDCNVNVLITHFCVKTNVIKERLMDLSGMDFGARWRMDELRKSYNDNDIEMNIRSDNKENNSLVQELVYNSSNGVCIQEFVTALDIKSDELHKILQELMDSFQVYLKNDRYFAF